MEKYILISIIILIVILIIIYFVHKKMSENFESEQISNYNILDDLLFRKSKNLDIVEKNAYMDSPVNDIVNTDYLHEFKFLGPAWEGEFMYDNPDEMQMNYRRDKLLENFDRSKTYKMINNSSYCGGYGNKCRVSSDCCGRGNCYNGTCFY
jgi:hypothetical protein